MQIKHIPNKLKKTIMINKKTIIELKGLKKVSKKENMIIIELTNKYRVWLLKTEI
uniref:Cytochrome b6-f complex subunit PetP n=1 Tax=Erythrocystis saccata TaxID=2822695 RepID=A0A8E6L370_9FLOR|nr:cytochrome b6-f complex subunit PetP [Erythrocystis saccata]